jgi:hypothetical protein
MRKRAIRNVERQSCVLNRDAGRVSSPVDSEVANRVGAGPRTRPVDPRAVLPAVWTGIPDDGDRRRGYPPAGPGTRSLAARRPVRCPL